MVADVEREPRADDEVEYEARVFVRDALCSVERQVQHRKDCPVPNDDDGPDERDNHDEHKDVESAERDEPALFRARHASSQFCSLMIALNPTTRAPAEPLHCREELADNWLPTMKSWRVRIDAERRVLLGGDGSAPSAPELRRALAAGVDREREDDSARPAQRRASGGAVLRRGARGDGGHFELQ